MQEDQKPPLRRSAISFLGVVGIVVIVAIVYSLVNRSTALIVGGVLAVILFIVVRLLKNAEVKTASTPYGKVVQAKQPSPNVQEKPTYTEKDITELIMGLWATQDPTEPDYRDGIMRAGYYRQSCADKLRKLGKEAIPYLEPYAERKEVAPLLEELKQLP
jgi:hypothetical protein